VQYQDVTFSFGQFSIARLSSDQYRKLLVVSVTPHVQRIGREKH